jgi:tRNA 2-selenouridine synthase
MPFAVHRVHDLIEHGFDTLVDVRSPAEFAEDHVPGAINLPVLSDAERAEIGTIYVQDEPFRARKIGAALVARNAARHLEGPLAGMGGGWRPLVYCWRGGQRSGSFASILRQVGWRVDTVEGGYKTWRGAVVSFFHEAPWPTRVVLLDGNTGTAKTELLGVLARRGVQVLDLEQLARHRGSVFGEVATPQPSQKAFETALAEVADRLDPERVLLVEAESSKIGERLIPPSLWKAMRAASRIVVEAPLASRATYLVRTYQDAIADRERLLATLAALKRLQGAEVVAEWQTLAQAGALEPLAADLMRRHYDPRYAKHRREGADVLATIRTEALDPPSLETLADRIARTLDLNAGAAAG